MHRPYAGTVQRLGDGGDVPGGGKAGQLGFREDHQVGIRPAGGDGRQGAFEVVGGVAARKLEISAETVKFHRKHIYSKLGIKSQSELFGLFLKAQEG